MNENEEKVMGQEIETMDDLDLLNEYKNLKENTVSKEEYQKQVEKNKLLMRQIINGGGTKGESKETIDLGKIREEIFIDTENLTNLDFWKKVLTLRKERLEKEGTDVFAPRGQKTRYTREDLESANKVAEVIEQCIEESEDNPQLFTAILNSRIQ